MTWLNAALAFALSMIVFSTIVSALTECMHRVFHMREAGLERMLEQVFERHVKPALAAQLDKVDVALVRTNFTEALRRNLAVDGTAPVGWLRAWSAPRYLDSLSTREFVQRLADTEIGKMILERPLAEKDRIVNDLASRFERLGTDASLFFQHRAGFVSFLFALVVAFGLNVDPVRLFSSFIVDHQLTSQILGQQEAVMAASQQQQQRLAEAQQQPADDALLKASYARFEAAVEQSTLLGLPIGSAYFPWCREVAQGGQWRDARCAGWTKALDVEGYRAVAGAIVAFSGVLAAWLATTFLAGVMIGLGGPFWFDAARRLSQVIDGLRTSEFLRRDDPAAKAQSGAEVKTAASAPAAQTAAELFASSAEAHVAPAARAAAG
jgi:hypothetical protein